MSDKPEITRPVMHTLLDGFATKTAEEIAMLVDKGLNGISVIGTDSGDVAVMLFAGPKAGLVFTKLREVMQEMPEYQALTGRQQQS